MKKNTITQEEIIAEYLAGGTSYRKLEKKYGIPGSTISGWIHKLEGRKISWRERMKRKQAKQEAQLGQPPEDVKQLQAALRKSQLYNKLLEEILRLSEQHTGIELRKKFGTKQS